MLTLSRRIDQSIVLTVADDVDPVHHHHSVRYWCPPAVGKDRRGCAAGSAGVEE